MPTNTFDLQNLSHPVTHQTDMRASFTNRKRPRRLPAPRFQAPFPPNLRAKHSHLVDKASSLIIRQQEQAPTRLYTTLEPNTFGDNNIIPSIETNEVEKPIQEASDTNDIYQGSSCSLDDVDSQDEASLDISDDQSLNTSSKDESYPESLNPLPANTHAFAASLNNLTHSAMPITEEDLESEADFIEFDYTVGIETTPDFEEFAPPVLEPTSTDVIGVPSRPVTNEISDFALALGIWAETEGIKRKTYTTLLEVLKLLHSPEVDALPQRLGTLHMWCRNRIPLPPVQCKVIPVKQCSQPSLRPKKISKEFDNREASMRLSSGNMFYFDARTLIATLLSQNLRSRLHTGMAELVECPTELWHSTAWASSIRTCSQDFVRYPDYTPVIPSDFIIYQCSNLLCQQIHCGQVISFARDKREYSPTFEQVVVTVKPVLDMEQAKTSPYALLLSSVSWQTGENILIEGANVEIGPSNILAHRSDIAIKRPQKCHARVLINRVFSIDTSTIRDVSLLKPVRGELEIEAYGRSSLISHLENGIISFPLLMFIDDFGLYRNMYRALTGIYVMPAGLPIEERQRPTNAYTLTLGPHGANFKDVIATLHTNIKALDDGCLLRINGADQLVWAPILAFLGDMKQQQLSSGFLGPRANRCCRFCDATLDNRHDLTRCRITNGRYHHQLIELRQKGNAISKRTDREKYFASLGLSPEPPVLQSITPALDLILSRPPDPAHSEYFGLVRRLYPLLYSKILTKSASAEFTRVFQNFPFPPGWARLQSPETHMRSWTMSECGKASLVTPLILRSWLKHHHLHKAYCDALSREFPREGRPGNKSDVHLIIYSFGKLAKSNSLISSLHLSPEDRREFHQQILEARRYFVGLMNAGSSSTGMKRAQRATSSNRRASLSPSVATFPGESVIDFQNDMSLPQLVDDDHQLDGPASRLPNYHIGLHFEEIMEEFGLLWNANVLFGEAKHAVFKNDVLATNHRRPERQLLIKDAIRFTIRAILDNAFAKSDAELSKLFEHLQECCPTLLKDTMGSISDETVDYNGILDIGKYAQIAVRGKFKSKTCQQKQMPSRMNGADPTFLQLIESAMRAYSIQGIIWGSRPIYWYEQCSYTCTLSKIRHTLHIGDYVVLYSGRYAQVLKLFTHCLQFESYRRVFVWVQILEEASYHDEILNLPIFHPTREARILPLSQIESNIVYFIPIAQQEEQIDLLYCPWEVNFL